MSLLLSTWPDVLLFVWVNNFDWTTSFYCSYMPFYSSCPFSWALGSWLGSMYMHIDIVHTWCKVTQLSGNASPQNSHGIMASSVGVYQICLHIYWWINTNAFSHVPLYMHAAMYPFWLQRLCTFFCIDHCMKWTCMLPTNVSSNQVVHCLESNADSKTPLCLMMPEIEVTNWNNSCIVVSTYMVH